MKPHNVPFVALGAGLLWFGWFGFNAGSELTVDAVAGLAFINTQVATAAAVLGWIVVEWIRDGKPTLVGASSGAVAGLVAITPACGFIAPWAAVLLGLVAGVVCALAVSLKYKLGYDDSLDVVGVHFVGGWIGSLWLGLFATNSVNAAISDVVGASDGLFYGGGLTQLGRQALAGADRDRLVVRASPGCSASSSRRRSASGSRPRPRSRASTSPSTRRAATTSSPARRRRGRRVRHGRHRHGRCAERRRPQTEPVSREGRRLTSG